jgi:hypothetical protein
LMRTERIQESRFKFEKTVTSSFHFALYCYEPFVTFVMHGW